MTPPWLAEWWPHVTALATVAAMLATAAHVLLHKRDTRSAVGWLGLVWFAPILGVVFYWIFGINRIRRKAQVLFAERRAVELPSLACALSAQDVEGRTGSRDLAALAHLTDEVAARPLTDGNHIVPLHNGDEAYPEMIGAIDGAESTIALCSYIFDNDLWGKRFGESLVAARRRGVEVRVLVDDVGARYSLPSIAWRLRRRGVPTARFMKSRMPWRFRYYNLRNHRKILVVDGRLGFTGGMNIAAPNVHRDGPKRPIRDLHFRVEGPVVSQMQVTFATDWLFATGEELKGPEWFPRQEEQGPTLARGISDGPDDDFDKLRLTILGALACARRSVRVATPYFLPDGELEAGLKIAALRGLEVQILLPERNNLRMVKWAATAGLDELIATGCQVFLTPPPFDHSKVMVVDGAWVLLGSANWDPRSLQLNFEFNLECYGEELAARVEELLDGRRRHAREVTLRELRARPLAARLRDHAFRLFSPYL